MKHNFRYLIFLILIAGTFSCKKNTEEVPETTSEIYQNTKVVRSNGKLAFDITFISPIKTGVAQETRNWSPADIDRTLVSIDRWLEIVRGIKGHNELYTVHLTIAANADLKSNGGAFVDDHKKLGDDLFMPSDAGFEILGEMFSKTWTDEKEFHANVLHETGHILGIGSMFQLVEADGKIIPGPYPVVAQPSNAVRNWLKKPPKGSRGNVGWKYIQPMGTQKYLEVFDNGLDFLPISSDGGHVFTVGFDADLNTVEGPWVLPDGTEIPMMREELMGHGFALSKITLGILDDLGYEVDYTLAEAYTKENP